MFVILSRRSRERASTTRRRTVKDLKMRKLALKPVAPARFARLEILRRPTPFRRFATPGFGGSG
jgi:hypothetical protein